jgi:hypothetical protein
MKQTMVVTKQQRVRQARFCKQCIYRKTEVTWSSDGKKLTTYRKVHTCFRPDDMLCSEEGPYDQGWSPKMEGVRWANK